MLAVSPLVSTRLVKDQVARYSALGFRTGTDPHDHIMRKQVLERQMPRRRSRVAQKLIELEGKHQLFAFDVC